MHDQETPKVEETLLLEKPSIQQILDLYKLDELKIEKRIEDSMSKALEKPQNEIVSDDEE